MVQASAKSLLRVIRTRTGCARCVLKFSVSDSGMGIPNEKIHRLFHRFSQVDESLTRKYGGTGLGLAISKQIVEMMGGAIGVESELGAGSTFYFTAVFGYAKGAEKTNRAEDRVPHSD